MPRGRPKGSKNAKTATEPKPSPQAIKVIDESSFRKLVKALQNAVAEKDEAVATIGGLISSAVEKKHLHKKAFAMYRGIARLSDAHLATVLAHFDHYREIGGLDERASKQQEMFARPEVGETEDDETNVVDFDKSMEFEPEAA